ncbi:GNAT family N-acetyltransferase [Teredinibacter franksiae]|uniref:GNAT family N-acetyltransferase n=1 Tax=Teredinibacter franksiae TaxID=2761453 RepID=UPI0016248741|nr:GNAT family N-acetyltransferase [Teredinibacter franksiae]
MKLETLEYISPKEWEYLTQWRETVFPIEGKEIQWSPSTHHVIARDNDQKPVGHIGYGHFVVQSGSYSFSIIGVGGVVVRPEYQGQGVPKRLFEQLHKNTPSSDCLRLYTLFCPARLECYYKKHGYQKYTGLVKILQMNQLVTTDFSFMFRGDTIFGSELNLTSNPW